MTLQSVQVDIHGLVGLELIGASADDVAAVLRQVGGMRAQLGRDPDIVIEFANLPAPRSTLRYLGGDAGFTDDALVVFDRGASGRVIAELRLQEIGRQATVLCQRGLGAVPRLVNIVDITALGKGALPLHAAAFAFGGVGCIVTGWPRGGKTSALLGFMAAGAEFIADDRVYLRASDGKVLGVASGLELSYRHLRDFSNYRHNLRPGERARLRALGALERGQSTGRRSRLARAAGRVTGTVTRRLTLNVEPNRLFRRPADALALACSFDRLFIVVGHDGSLVEVERLSADAVADRLTSLLLFERLPLTTSYLKFRFAFPDKTSSLVEEAAVLEQQLLSRLLAGKEMYSVYHPYPSSAVELYEAMRPYCV